MAEPKAERPGDGEEARPRRRAKKSKKEKKHVVHGVAHVHASFNNTHVTITDLEGQRGDAGRAPGTLGLQGLAQGHALRGPAGRLGRRQRGQGVAACARWTFA